MALELWSLPSGEQGGLSVRLLYNGKVMQEFGKDGMMPLAEFQSNILDRFSVTGADQHKQLCNAALTRVGGTTGAVSGTSTGAATEDRTIGRGARM